jgi:hypothetical protein
MGSSWLLSEDLYREYPIEQFGSEIVLDRLHTPWNSSKDLKVSPSISWHLADIWLDELDKVLAEENNASHSHSLPPDRHFTDLYSDRPPHPWQTSSNLSSTYWHALPTLQAQND